MVKKSTGKEVISHEFSQELGQMSPSVLSRKTCAFVAVDASCGQSPFVSIMPGKVAKTKILEKKA